MFLLLPTPMLLLLLVLFSAAATISSVSALYGMDVSEKTNVAQLRCLKQVGYRFVIVRVWRSTGKVDDNATETIANAREAGFTTVDGYIFPCFNCRNGLGPREQIRQLLQQLDRNSSSAGRYNRLWLDVEQMEEYWGPNRTENVKFIQEMVSELEANRKSFGIYTSKHYWTDITGGTTQFSKYPLWYSHFDGQNNFDDFVPFGGWTEPMMKQYDVGFSFDCFVMIDLNWKPMLT